MLWIASIKTYKEIFIFFTDFVACSLEKLIMASVWKCKGKKTSLMIGKKSEKYRKLSQSINLKQSLNTQQLLQEAIPLEDNPDTCTTNPTAESHEILSKQIHQKCTQVESIEVNDVPIPITNPKNVTQRKCKVIRVEHAYNHIQVRPVYNKQR